VPVSAREAVLIETRAACATSLSVTLIKPADRLQTIAKRYWLNMRCASLNIGSMLLNTGSFLQTFAESCEYLREVAVAPRPRCRLKVQR
jgi:hypothetical protein